MHSISFSCIVPKVFSALFFVGFVTDLLAGFAKSLSLLAHVGIQRIIRMALRAMSFLGIKSGYPYTAQYILATSNNLEMNWMNTRPYAAKMVNCESFWYGSDQKFVSKPMGKNKFLAILKQAIPFLLEYASGPKPTRSAVPKRPVFVNFSPEPLESGIIKEHQEPPILGVMRRAVNAAPVPFIVPQEV